MVSNHLNDIQRIIEMQNNGPALFTSICKLSTEFAQNRDTSNRNVLKEEIRKIRSKEVGMSNIKVNVQGTEVTTFIRV